ncbi:hypothetical protein PV04_01956 [Phialophora macrospora]|uniref:Thioredoxin-like fold domain-containing protein n=1 Tax=Phialophora macrospora TaxID=1851006 RepID=A0A0D2FZC4_9EURO|nr:hypothetical protein PV04_01956 [Phialophora macrospora]
MPSQGPKLTLFRGWPDRGKYVASPFVTKLEFRLRHARLPYCVEAGSAKAAPKGKIPYVDLGALVAEDGSEEGSSRMGDSTFIIQWLLGMGKIPDLNGELTVGQKLEDLALRALLEEKLYFYHMRERWLENFYTQRDTALYAIPYPVRVVVGYLVHRTVSSTLHGQGVGRLTAEEVRGLKTEIWQSIDSVLEQRLHGAHTAEEPVWILGGVQPSECDATLFGFIVSVLASDSAPGSKKLVKTFPAVIEYARRIHNGLFPDYEVWA